MNCHPVHVVLAYISGGEATKVKQIAVDFAHSDNLNPSETNNAKLENVII